MKYLKGVLGFYIAVLLTTIISIPVANLFNTAPAQIFFFFMILNIGGLCWFLYAKAGNFTKAKVAIFTALAYYLLRMIAGHYTGLTIANTGLMISYLFGIQAPVEIPKIIWQSFALDVGILLSIFCVQAGFSKSKFIQKAATTVGGIMVIGAILAVVIPNSFERIIALLKQLDDILLKLLPKSLSVWALLVLLVLAAIIFSVAKSKKPGEEITGWIVLGLGFFIILAIIGGLVSIFGPQYGITISPDKIEIHPESSAKSGKTVSALPKSRPVKVIKILDPETQIHIVRAPADSLTNSNICSKNGYLRIEVGDLTQNIQTPVGYVSARGYDQYYPPEKLLLPSAPAFALLAAYGKDKSSLFPVVTEGQDFFETNSAKKGEPIYLVRNIKMQHNTLGNQISLVTIHTD